MRKPKHPPSKAILTVVFAIIVFVVLTITTLIMGSVVLFLNNLGVLEWHNLQNAFIPTFAYGVASIVVGTLVATILSRIPLKPINKIIHGLNQLAKGEYGTRINLGHISVAQEISKSFNTLASELENTEMLRSDFVNNFSHEFKTPIVSICGFAKLLQKDTISSVQQKEYLTIIVDESTRLSELATNVLNLSKIENQSILTEVTSFNLSEQLRNSILMLEKKWTQKNLKINVEFDEYQIVANEEMLKQVWINLLDNAIKFSPVNSEVSIEILPQLEVINVLVKNQGPKLSDNELKHIFNKFWQGDTSHSSEGTGIGLSIAKRIIELHHGNISVNSNEEETIFQVLLPTNENK